MLGRGLHSRGLGRSVAVVGVAMLCAATTAAGALAATLSVNVIPATTHKGQTFAIQIIGSFKKSKHKKAFLLAFEQHALRPCKANATKELDRTKGAYYHHTVSLSPFVETTTLPSHSYPKGDRRGQHRVCAYLFPKKVHPGTHVRPIKRATATYRVT